MARHPAEHAVAESAAPQSPASLTAAFEAVASSPAGLPPAEATDRLRRFGPNRLKGGTHDHPLALLVGQFRSPLMLILLAAATITFAVGETTEASIILGIVLVSSTLAFYQEYRASNAMRALRDRLAIHARVRRGGDVLTVTTDEVVPGDILVLAAGSLVSADGLLLEAVDLHVDEAALTGESFPVEKRAAAATGPYAEDCHVRMGTSVRSGSAVALVVETGARTQFGSIARALDRADPETSFSAGIRRFGLLMTQIMLVMLAVILPINLLLGRPLLETTLFSAALAVGLTPELLPAIVSVTLSRGAQALARAGVLVRRLVAIENLGAMDVLCTDKTGTLTEGVVRLQSATDASGTPSPDVLRYAAINAVFQTGMPNPLDEAVAAAWDSNTSGVTRLDEVPYDFERKRLSVLIGEPGGTILICKGAAASVMAACSTVSRDGRMVPLGPAERTAEDDRVAAWGAQGIRVLAVATRRMSGTTCELADEREMTLVGYLLFSDRLKPDGAATVAELVGKGVKLKILTGDNRHVANSVAGEIGLRASHTLTGEEVAHLTDRGLARRAGSTDVFAELTPDQKERVVVALRRRGHVVGYLGDGVNDAPALRAADLGISVETAVEAAKEAADIVLMKRDLSVLLNGISLGRTAFANTIKYITITTSANLGNMISMAVASLFLPFLPLLAKQILLNNSLSDLPMLAISTDRVDAEVVARPGRWDFGALLRSMIAFGLISSIFDGITFATLLVLLHAGEADFQTGWFLVSLLTELVIIAVMRTRKWFFQSPPSAALILACAGVAAAAIALPYLWFAPELGFLPPSPAGLGMLLVIVLAYAVASELLKRRIARHRQRRNQRHQPPSV